MWSVKDNGLTTQSDRKEKTKVETSTTQKTGRNRKAL